MCDDSFMCVPRLIHVCDTNRLQGQPTSSDKARDFFQVPEATPWWRAKHGF